MKDTNLLEGLSEEIEPASDENAEVGEEVAKDYHQKKIERLSEEIEDLKQDRQQRKVFSSRIFIFMCAYMAVSLIIVFLTGIVIINLDPSIIKNKQQTKLENKI